MEKGGGGRMRDPIILHDVSARLIGEDLSN